MRLRISALVVTGCLWAAATGAQTAAPTLTRDQRAHLEALIAAVDRAAAEPAPSDHHWLTHVLRASDGSHYVAFSVTPPAASLPDRPIVLYVRLATTAPANVTAVAERSVVREWLRGSRVDPRLLPRRGGIAIGEMPPMGAGGIGARGAASVGSGDLQAINLQRDRQRERREEEERRRKAALEGAGSSESDLLPFEDFEISTATAFPDGTRAIQRALTAGPGTFTLYAAWTDASVPPSRAQVHVARRSLRLGPAMSTEFGLSSIIVADRIGVRAAPHDSLAQRAHPYTVGVTEIVPARDAVFTPAEQIAVAFQIVNPFPAETGKPDVLVSLRIARMNGAREEPVAALSPLTYNASTLPGDFDIRLGHPLFAAMAAPLATIPRGEYRLVITAEDRLSASVVADAVPFTVIGTPESLLAEAPPLGRPFRVADTLAPALVADLIDRLTPPAPSPVLARALQSARDGRFADLLVADAVPDAEQGVRTALGGMALLSLGNPAALAEFQRAVTQRAPAAATQLLLGASRALAGRHAEAVTAWEAARDAGFTPAVTDRLIADAYLRLKDPARAAATLRQPPPAVDPAALRVFAATRIATGQFSAAVAALEPLLAAHPDDVEARWLLLHALYAEYVGGNRAHADRIATVARLHIERQGPQAALAAEWLKVVRP